MAPARQQPHLYRACRDHDCTRPSCVAYKEGRQDGYEDGYSDGYAAGAAAAGGG